MHPVERYGSQHRHREDETIGGTGNPYYLGIDLGTTFTAAAVHRSPDLAEMADLGSHGPVVPSVLVLRDDGELLCGEAAHRRAATEPQRVAREFKRRVGDPTPLIVDRTPFAADALMARLLAWTAGVVGAAEGRPPAGVAVTHPANWGVYKLDVLHQAIRAADLTEVTLVSEPEAAAIHYATQERLEPGAVVAVYDLGGGTFDAAVLRRTATSWDVLGRPEGVERLGGVDIDEAVFRHVVDTAGLADLFEDEGPAAASSDPVVRAAIYRLRQDCTAAKEALSADTDTTIPVMVPATAATPARTSQVRLTRAELESMVRPTLQATVGALERSLRSAALGPDDVHAVLLAGGSSRIPLIAQLLVAELGRPIAVDAHPKHSVALGAARVAAEHRAGGSPASAAPVQSGVAGAGTGRRQAAPAFVAAVTRSTAPELPNRGGAGREPTPPGAVALASLPADGAETLSPSGDGTGSPSGSGDGHEVPIDQDDREDRRSGVDEVSPADPPAETEPKRSGRRRRGVVAVSALLLVALAGTLALRAGGRDDPSGSVGTGSGQLSADAPEGSGDWVAGAAGELGETRQGDPENDSGRRERTGDGEAAASDGAAGGRDRDGTSSGGAAAASGANAAPGGETPTTVEAPDQATIPTTSTTPRRRVPTVVGRSASVAQTMLEEAGFVAVYEPCPSEGRCEVVEQDPAGDRRAPEGSRVHLTVETVPA